MFDDGINPEYSVFNRVIKVVEGGLMPTFRTQLTCSEVTWLDGPLTMGKFWDSYLKESLSRNNPTHGHLPDHDIRKLLSV